MKHSDKDIQTIRLQVYLSHNGVCSRRDAMTVIQQGRVELNGVVVTEPSTPVISGKDRVFVDGKGVKEKRFQYILLNKARGFVTTTDDERGQRTVYQLLPRQYAHLLPVGRLDRDTEGLLLLTNDGDTAYKLTHPSFNIDKTYFVRIKGMLDIKDKEKLKKGIYLGGKRTSPAQIHGVQASKQYTDFYMVIHEGWKRQIRLMVAKVGYEVIYLKRISQGPLRLGKLRPGEFRLLTKEEINALKAL